MSSATRGSTNTVSDVDQRQNQTVTRPSCRPSDKSCEQRRVTLYSLHIYDAQYKSFKWAIFVTSSTFISLVPGFVREAETCGHLANRHQAARMTFLGTNSMCAYPLREPGGRRPVDESSSPSECVICIVKTENEQPATCDTPSSPMPSCTFVSARGPR
jgi:hypothetical protein